MPLHRLSPLGVKNARPGRHCDGRGLWLFISPNPETGQLRKSWVYRYKRDGRERAMGLGSLDDVPLAEAREKAAAARKLFLAGEDPIEVRESARNQKRLTAARAMTFSQCAEAYIAAHHPAWRSARHLRQWNELASRLRDSDPRPAPGSADRRGAGDEGSATDLAVENRNRLASPATCGVDSSIRATASGFRSGENPARWRGYLENLLPQASKVQKVKHLAALPYGQLAGFLTELRARPGLAARALEFTILTATRSGEVLGARWSEIDFESPGLDRLSRAHQGA